mmetsp:Transcript_25354/g.45924  ORF Transcript_25354/g.45924 Transcript_25354/m.45924 type:complete len:536 (+) Transcript_25354:124-1731(+)|eukprot:CAMPEP_0197652960 /NCGR_PEP_ID=MMETSP1338-20131121/34762_1 /TAXON_ID=43686 ORGANISM="Pelagodinium beii, Strain RCC1491" /NCGR_SAMPLE_ID=MMETSP1338 /ASSEMBLY_ACC=CAM_ASM_000754 /LENGTH=535 /DNA_ID=CAMNT_0043227939 /DNA_START=123 /DNA_END=1730 /DNA_ORIENTATION=-
MLRIGRVFLALAGLGCADVGYELLVQEAGADVPRTCFQLPNELPKASLGAFFISGPAKFEIGGYRFKSFFDGYGRVNRFELNDREVCFTAKFLNTTYLQKAESLGRICNGPKFLGTEPELPDCPLKDPACFITGAMLDNNWVNLMPGVGEGLLVTDSPFFVRLDYDTLTVRGAYPWKDALPMSDGLMPTWMNKFHVPATGSAHPLLRPKTATYVEIMLELAVTPFSNSTIALYTIDSKTLDRALLAHVPVKSAQYFHSFGVTENYVVLPCNLKMTKPDFSKLVNSFHDAWDGIHVVDLKGNVQVFDTDKFFHVHIANTFENSTGIVMDLGTWQHLPFSPHQLATDEFLNKTIRDSKTMGSQVERLHLHLQGPHKGEVSREVLSPPGRQTDFFKINPLKNGLPYCIYYAVEWFHDDQAYASMAILKHDLCQRKRTYWAKQYSYPSEPIFIPTGTEEDAEDKGLVAFVTLDGTRKASDFVILDAATLEEMVVVQLPVHIPFLAHGQFIPRQAREIVKAALDVEHPELAAAVEATFQI